MPVRPNVPWTDKEDEVLKSMVNDYTASQIGQRLGRSRNSVISRAHRKGFALKARGTHERTERQRQQSRIMHLAKGSKRRAQRARRTAKGKASIRDMVAPDLPCTPLPELPKRDPNKPGVAFINLSPKACRWPFDDDTFCGEDKINGSPYCHEHKAISVRKDQPTSKRVPFKINSNTGAGRWR